MTPQEQTFPSSFKGKGKLSWRSQEKDRLVHSFLILLSLLLVFLILIFLTLLIYHSLPAVQQFGLHFVVSKEWNPVTEEYGALPFLFGTLITSLLAVTMATPLAIATALFITEVCPRKLSQPLSFLIETIAAIPSIIFGLWGLFTLIPWTKENINPFLTKILGFLPLFQGPNYGPGILVASIVLAIMVIPIISALCRECFSAIPKAYREAYLALGSTTYEMIKNVVLRPSSGAITTSVFLALGRVLGETMAVAMVIGNSPLITTSLFSPASTMASVIANEYAEATSDLHIASLTYVALLLLLMTLLMNFCSRMMIKKLIRGKNL